MKNRLSLRIIAGYTLFLVLLATILVIVIYGMVRDFYLVRFVHNLSETGSIFSRAIAGAVAALDYSGLDAVVATVPPYLHMTVVDARGIVLADSELIPSLMENQSYRAEVRSALSGQTVTNATYNKVIREDSLFVATPLIFQGHIVGALVLNRFVDSFEVFFRSVLVRMITIGGLILLAAILLSYIIARRLFSPLGRLSEAASLVSRGDFDAASDVSPALKGDDEIGDLSAAFGTMLREIRTLFARIESDNMEMTALLDGMSDGLILLTSDLTIKRLNRAFTDMFLSGNEAPLEISPSATKPLESFSAGKAVAEILRSIMSGNEDFGKYSVFSFSFGGCEYECSLLRLGTRNESVLLFHDVTERKLAERFKRDLVANVSHELRTPLTSIKGFLETMETAGKYDQEYVDIMKHNTERLIRMVRDLLYLSELDRNAEVSPCSERFDVSELAGRACALFAGVAAGKGLSFSCTKDESPIFVEGEKTKMEQLFINLLDNAVKYTEAGFVRCNVAVNGVTVTVTVSDSGIGIPAEDIPRIFERFFVSERSRTRDMAGTGLGLAIAGEIAQRNGAEIHVDSQPGVGSVFSVTMQVVP